MSRAQLCATLFSEQSVPVCAMENRNAYITAASPAYFAGGQVSEMRVLHLLTIQLIYITRYP